MIIVSYLYYLHDLIIGCHLLSGTPKGQWALHQPWPSFIRKVSSTSLKKREMKTKSGVKHSHAATKVHEPNYGRLGQSFTSDTE